MGYLSQKKRNIRENNVLISGLVIILVLSFLLFFDNVSFLKNNFFIIYIINIIFTFYAFCVRRYSLGLLFSIFVFINFFHITSTSRLFFNKSYNNGYEFIVSYDADKLDKGASEIEINKITNNIISYTYKLTKQDNDISIVKLDLSNQTSSTRQQQLNLLYKFIVNQDIPVVVLGDFGTSVWQPSIQRFLEKTHKTQRQNCHVIDLQSWYKRNCKFPFTNTQQLNKQNNKQKCQ